MAVKSCPHCGAENSSGTSVCTVCGKRIIDLGGSEGTGFVPLKTSGSGRQFTMPADKGRHVKIQPALYGDELYPEPKRRGGLIVAVVVLVAALAIAGSAVAGVGPFSPSDAGEASDTKATTTDTDSTEAADVSGSAAATDASGTSASASASDASGSASAAASDASASAAAASGDAAAADGRQGDGQAQQQDAQPADQGGGGTSGAAYNYYVLPDSSWRYLSEGELTGLSNEQLWYARNEIYARHGRMFNNQTLQNYFYNQEWYTALYTPDQWNSMGFQLSDVERNNSYLIQKVEAARNSPYRV